MQNSRGDVGEEGIIPLIIAWVVSVPGESVAIVSETVEIERDSSESAVRLRAAVVF